MATIGLNTNFANYRPLTVATVAGQTRYSPDENSFWAERAEDVRVTQRVNNADVVIPAAGNYSVVLSAPFATPYIQFNADRIPAAGTQITISLLNMEGEQREDITGKAYSPARATRLNLRALLYASVRAYHSGGGLATVATNSTLTGDGSAGAPLAVATPAAVGDITDVALNAGDLRITRRSGATFDLDLPAGGGVANANPYHFEHLLKDVATPNIADANFDDRIDAAGDGITLPFMPQTTFANDTVIRNRAFITQPEGFVNFSVSGTTANNYEVIVVTTHVGAGPGGADIVTRERKERREVVIGFQEVALAAFQSTVKLDAAAADGVTTPAPPVKMDIVINLYNNTNRVTGTLSSLTYNKCGVFFWQLANVGGGSGGGNVPDNRLLPATGGAAGREIVDVFTGNAITPQWRDRILHWNGAANTNPGFQRGDTVRYPDNGANQHLYRVISAVAPNTPFSSLATGVFRRIDGVANVVVSGTTMTVTDAVGGTTNYTVQGGGGLATVSTDSTITGDGSSGAPLRVANPFTADDESKLDGIAAGATVGATAAQVQAIGLNTAKRSFPTAAETKLNSIAAGAQVNPTTAQIIAGIEAQSGNARLNYLALKNLPTNFITSVSSNATLTGDGTAALPLAVATPATADDLVGTPSILAGNLIFSRRAGSAYTVPLPTGSAGTNVRRVLLSSQVNVVSGNAGNTNTFNAGQNISLDGSENFGDWDIIYFVCGYDETRATPDQDNDYVLAVDGTLFRASTAAARYVVQGTDTTTSGYAWGVYNNPAAGETAATSTRVNVSVRKSNASGGGGGNTYIKAIVGVQFRGQTGAQGAEGMAGADGAAGTITVGTVLAGAPGSTPIVTNTGTSSAATLNFTIPRGATGATGAAGADGQNGSDGAAATIAIGTVSTGTPGSNASVANSGSSSAAVFNFTIPRGDRGAAGQDGADGSAATLTIAGADALAAGSAPTVTEQTGSSPQARIYRIGVPRGNTGAQGAPGTNGTDGQDGAAATIQIGTVTAGAPGTTPTVANAGSSSAAVFNFVIPSGLTGPPGAAGTPGQNGQDGAAATIQISSVTTLAAGENATVTEAPGSTAQARNYILGIPRGADGQAGGGTANKLGRYETAISDLNSIDTANDNDHLWGIARNPSNVPTGVTGDVMVRQWRVNGDEQYQKLIELSTNKEFRRVKNGAAWGDWQEGGSGGGSGSGGLDLISSSATLGTMSLSSGKTWAGHDAYLITAQVNTHTSGQLDNDLSFLIPGAEFRAGGTWRKFAVGGIQSDGDWGTLREAVITVTASGGAVTAVTVNTEQVRSGSFINNFTNPKIYSVNFGGGAGGAPADDSIGRSKLKFAAGTNEGATRLLALTAGDDLTTVAQGGGGAIYTAGNGIAISSANAISIDAATRSAIDANTAKHGLFEFHASAFGVWTGVSGNPDDSTNIAAGTVQADGGAIYLSRTDANGTARETGDFPAVGAAITIGGISTTVAAISQNANRIKLTLAGANQLITGGGVKYQAFSGNPSVTQHGVYTDATIMGSGDPASPLAVANPFTAADEAKLDGIEANATADQTGAEMIAAINADTGGTQISASKVAGGGGGTPADDSIGVSKLDFVSGTDESVGRVLAIGAGGELTTTSSQAIPAWLQNAPAPPSS